MQTNALSEYRKMLEDCATQFQYYADLHAAKGTWESDKKAEVNRQWVVRIRKLLDGTA